jgi:ParB family chromosome partitioning protein
VLTGTPESLPSSVLEHRSLPAHYNPDTGLRSIADAEAGEQQCRRARDTDGLLKAIVQKIEEQAKYIVWRDGAVAVVKRMNAGPGRGRKGKKNLSPVRVAFPRGDPGEKTAHRWRKSFCSKGSNGTEIDPEKVKVAFEEARLRCIRICEQQSVTTVRGTEGTGEFERYTPARYAEAVREVLGQIDLDPASSDTAQRTVRAECFYTERDNGLVEPWLGQVFLNAPYHRELLPHFVDKLVAEIAAGHTTQAILLTNNCTDTDWFDVALRACSSVCFTHGRIRFIEATGVEMGTPTQGQAFLYFGTQPDRFEQVFHHIGPCLRPSKHYASLTPPAAGCEG